MTVIPFEPKHLWQIRLQPSQVIALSYITPEYALALSTGGPAVSAEHNGEIIACCGVAYTAFKGGMLWGFVSKDAGRHMVRLHKCLRRFLGLIKARRLDATVEAGFAPGCRWLALLGFECEGLMRAFGPDGSDHLRFARVT